MQKFKNYRIPNRDVKLNELEVAITSTRTFQRLFFLKQLGLAYLVYPCATHTRAGHSIECLDEATKLLMAVGVKEIEGDWGEVRLAALLHDIGHVPFSHTLEDENQVLPKHDKKDRIESVFKGLKDELSGFDLGLIDKAKDILLSIATKDEEGIKQNWKSDLVGNTVCADLLAYITTDAAWTGIEKRPGYYRIYDYFKRCKKETKNGEEERLCIQLTKGGLRTDIVSAVLDLLDMRYALTERVIFHHAKAIASAMLARVARLIDLKEEPKLLKMGDEGFLDFLENKIKEPPNNDKKRGAETLLNYLRSRKLYKRIFKIQRRTREEWDRTNSYGTDTFCDRWRKSEEIEDLLGRLEDRFKLPWDL